MSQTPSLPAPPRPLDRPALKAASREVEVRSLLLVAVGVIVAILAVGVRQLVHGIGDRMLFRNGVLVEATIENIDGANRNVDRSIQRKLRLSFKLKPTDEKPTVVEGFSTPMPGIINQHDKIPLRVDPNDVNNWTERAEPVPWAKSMIAPMVLTPPMVLLLGLAALKRRAFTSIYRDGQSLVGNVKSVERSALAPGQRVVKLVIAGGEGRIIGVTVPASLAPAEATGTIAVLAKSAAASRAIAVDAYR